MWGKGMGTRESGTVEGGRHRFFSFPCERRQTEPVKRRKPNESVSPLGMQLREIRAQYLAGGGDVLALGQFDQELAQRRGERNPGE